MNAELIAILGSGRSHCRSGASHLALREARTRPVVGKCDRLKRSRVPHRGNSGSAGADPASRGGKR